jgi:hypothetical protein
VKVTGKTVNHQSMPLQCRQMGAARDECDFIRCSGKFSAEKPADGSAPHDRNAHNYSPNLGETLLIRQLDVNSYPHC